MWFALLDDPEFLKELSMQGHSTERNFSEYKTRHNLKVSSFTPNYLSIDFYSGQSRELRDKNCFIIKTGKGNFAIFDENRFEKSYLDLDLSIAEELDYEIPKNFEHLDDAFKENLIENFSIEHLWFLGIFNQIIGRISLENECYIGPRGIKRSIFDVYFKDKKHRKSLKFLNIKGWKIGITQDLQKVVFISLKGKTFLTGKMAWI